MAEDFTPVRARLDDLAQGNRFCHQFRTDGPTEKMMVVNI
jgi:hypothetical protein